MVEHQLISFATVIHSSLVNSCSFTNKTNSCNPKVKKKNKQDLIYATLVGHVAQTAIIV